MTLPCEHRCLVRDQCCRCRGYASNCAECVLADPNASLSQAMDRRETDRGDMTSRARTLRMFRACQDHQQGDVHPPGPQRPMEASDSSEVLPSPPREPDVPAGLDDARVPGEAFAADGGLL